MSLNVELIKMSVTHHDVVFHDTNTRYVNNHKSIANTKCSKIIRKWWVCVCIYKSGRKFTNTVLLIRSGWKVHESYYFFLQTFICHFNIFTINILTIIRKSSRVFFSYLLKFRGEKIKDIIFKSSLTVTKHFHQRNKILLGHNKDISKQCSNQCSITVLRNEHSMFLRPFKYKYETSKFKGIQAPSPSDTFLL